MSTRYTRGDHVVYDRVTGRRYNPQIPAVVLEHRPAIEGRREVVKLRFRLEGREVIRWVAAHNVYPGDQEGA